jgi:hypothetical protein
VGIVQFRIRTVVQPSPPGTKTTWRITKPEVGIQDEAIDTVVAAVKQIGVVVGELIGGIANTLYVLSLVDQLPAGPLFWSPVSKKA